MNNKIKHVTQERLKELFELTDKGLIRKVNGRGAGVHHTGYKIFRVDYRQYREHRLIWLYVHGKVPKFLDHIDGNKQNNNIDNLRKATKNQNQHNTILSSKNTSGVKGVSWNKQSQKWRARIKLKKKEIHIGNFTTLKEAEFAIRKAREKLHGKFTNHGIIS